MTDHTNDEARHGPQKVTGGVWAVAGVEVYLLLTEIRGWSDEQYESWLADAFLRLLGEPSASPRPEGDRGSDR